MPEFKDKTTITEGQTFETINANRDTQSFVEAEKKAEEAKAEEEAKTATDKITKESKEGQDSVKENLIGNAIVSTEGKSNTYTLLAETQASVNLDSYEGYTKVLSKLLLQIDGCIETAKYKKGLNKSGKETLKTAMAKLKQYRSIITGKKGHLEHEFKQKNKLNKKNPDKEPLTVSISASEIEELKRRRNDRIKNIEFDIDEGKAGKSSNTAPWPNQSLEQVIKGNRVDSHHVEYDSKLNEALQDATFLHIIDNNQDKAREFLQAIANNSLSDAQITICQMRKVQLDPYFEKYGMKDQVYRCIQTRGGRYNQSYQNYGNMDLETAYKTGGIKGGLNNLLIKAFPNAKPEQVSNFTNIALAAGGIYAIYRVGKRFFGKNKEGKRNLLGKTLGLAGGYFGSQLLLGQDPFSLLGDVLSGKADFSEIRYRIGNSLRFLHGSSPEVYEQMAPGLLGMTIFPQTYTVTHVRALQQTFSDQNARKQRYSATYTRLNKDNSALANEFQNTFNANQYNENERKVFLAKLGITEKTSGDTIVFNEAMKIADKKTSFELWMKSQGKTRNPAFKKEIDNYLKQEGEFNPKNLNPNWFKEISEAKYTMRDIDFQNQEDLAQQIENLPITDSQKHNLKIAIQTFYDERSIESKPDLNDFSLDTEGNLLIIKSHGGNETKLDLNTNTLKGFGSTNGNSYEIKFSDLSEALDVADLTNDILQITNNQMPATNPPFRYEISKKAICFNDAKLRSLDFDTRILNINRFKNRGTIDQHASEYANYLSNRRIESSKIEINPRSYPLVKKLSDTGITFTNEDEVRNLETWLNEIKEGKKFAIGNLNGNPFKISRIFKELDHKLVFTAVDGTKEVFQEDISKKFPTIMINKDKFLTFMNNENNGMRGSEIANRTNK